MTDEYRPVLALTPGDPGGVGPEIVAAALADSALAREARLILVDRAGAGPHPPRPTARGGRASLEAFEEAIRLARAGEVDGIVTGPVDKRSLALAGTPFAGHTALLRERTGNPRLRMMMAAPEERDRWLRVVLVTDHIRLSDVPLRATREEVLGTLADTDRALASEFGISPSRLALLGMNPHAGDAGVLGDEEERVLTPALDSARAAGVAAEGPFPADGFFAAGGWRKFDAVVAIYHDQGLVPVKLAGGFRTIGITLGLPFVRTSVGHGTAFDRVGRADPTSLAVAIRTAAWLAKRRRTQGTP